MVRRDTNPGLASAGATVPDASSVVSSSVHARLAGVAFARGSFAPGTGVVHEIDLADPAMRRFGDYELIELIGRGGMGVVYRARQQSLDRDVAVKLLASGPWASRDFVERFRTEARNAAHMQHPNIVAIHEVGEIDALHFYSMRLVRGASLAHAIAGRRPTPQHAAKWLRTIAEAVDYAHRLGVLHLDLKPANVLIDENGEPHIADFGLARRLDLLLGDGEGIAGTPEYMAPEQALPGHALTAATDIWGLGAILYELVTGRPPHRGASVRETIELAAAGDVRAPREIAGDLPRDIEAIALKCLSKEPARRYASARALADDLQRFAEGRPVAARPLGAIERSWRWARREPRLAATALLAVGALVIGLAATTQQWRRATANAELARERLWQTRMDQAATALRNGLTYEALPPLVANIAEREAAGLDAHDDRVRLGIAERSAPRLIDAIALGSPISGVALSPDGGGVAVASEDEMLRLFDTASGALRWNASFAGATHSIPGMHNAKVKLSMLKFSEDGRFVIGRHRLSIPGILLPMGNDEVLFDVASGKVLQPPAERVPDFRDATYSADGAFALVHTRDAKVVLMRTSDWQVLGTPAPFDAWCLVTNGGRYVVTAEGPDPGFTDIAIRDAATMRVLHRYAYSVDQRASAWASSPDGAWLALGHFDGRVERIALASGQRDEIRPSPAARIGWMTFSPDGRWFGAVADSGDVFVWDTASGAAVAPPMRLDVQTSTYHRAQMAIDAGARMVLASSDTVMALWHVPGKLTPPVRLSGEFPNDDAFWFRATALNGPKGLVATDGGGGELRLWRVQPSTVTAIGAPLAAPTLRAADGRVVAVDGARVTIVAANDGRALAPTIELEQMPTFAELAEDGSSLVVVVGPMLHVYDAATGRPRLAPIALPNDPVRVIPSPDSRHVLFVFADYDDGYNRELVENRDLATGAAVSAPLAIEAGDGLRFGAGGAALLRRGKDAVVALDPLTLAPRWPLFDVGKQLPDGDAFAMLDAQFSADNAEIDALTLSGKSDDATLWRLDAATGAVRERLPLGSGGESFVTVPAREGVVVQRVNSGLLWWDKARGMRELASPGGITDYLALAAAPDGSMFASATGDSIQLRSTASLEWVSPPLSPMLPRGFEGWSDYPAELAFTADGRMLLGRSHRALLTQWNVAADERPARELAREAALLTSHAAASSPREDVPRRALRATDTGAPPAMARSAVPRIPPRRPDLPATLVNLDGAFNGDINSRDSDAEYDDWPEFAPGLHRYLGVDFDVRGGIALYFDGTGVIDAGTPHAPDAASKPHRVEGIRPGIDRFAALSVLVACGGALHRPERRPYAFVEIDYRDGTRERIPVLWRADVNGEDAVGKKGEVWARVAWRDTGAGLTRDRHAVTQLFQARFVNPHPDKPVASLALEAADEAWSTPAFLAITLEPRSR